jgi:hypothetical protein
VTEIVEIPNRGHGLVADSGWREVADTALRFVQPFVPATTNGAGTGQPAASAAKVPVSGTT